MVNKDVIHGFFNTPRNHLLYAKKANSFTMNQT